MSGMKMAPAHLKALLWIATDPRPIDGQPLVLVDLMNEGLIQCIAGNGADGRHGTTQKGDRLIRMWCDTPMPVREERWVDPREKA